MKHWFKRTVIGLAAIMTVTLGLNVGATPAHAASSDCPKNGYICLWKWIDHASGRWQQSYATLRSLPNGCWNLSGSKFTNGQAVDNESASLAYNALTGSNWTVTLYDSPNCSSGNGYREWASDKTAAYSNMSNLSGNWYHRVSSIQVSTNV